LLDQLCQLVHTVAQLFEVFLRGAIAGQPRRGRRHYGCEERLHPFKEGITLFLFFEDQAEERQGVDVEYLKNVEELKKLELKFPGEEPVEVHARTLARQTSFDLPAAQVGQVDEATQRLPHARNLRLTATHPGYTLRPFDLFYDN
jgi:hypothetical protein